MFMCVCIRHEHEYTICECRSVDNFISTIVFGDQTQDIRFELVSGLDTLKFKAQERGNALAILKSLLKA